MGRPEIPRKKNKRDIDDQQIYFPWRESVLLREMEIVRMDHTSGFWCKLTLKMAGGSCKAAPEFSPLLVRQRRWEDSGYRCRLQDGRLLNKTVHEVIDLTAQLMHQVSLQELDNRAKDAVRVDKWGIFCAKMWEELQLRCFSTLLRWEETHSSLKKKMNKSDSNKGRIYVWLFKHS